MLERLTFFMELRLAVHDSVLFKLGYATIFKLQLGESVVGKRGKNTGNTGRVQIPPLNCGGCT